MRGAPPEYLLPAQQAHAGERTQRLRSILEGDRVVSSVGMDFMLDMADRVHSRYRCEFSQGHPVAQGCGNEPPHLLRSARGAGFSTARIG